MDSLGKVLILLMAVLPIWGDFDGTIEIDKDFLEQENLNLTLINL